MILLLLFFNWLAMCMCSCGDSVVTLEHGGQIRGLRTNWNTQPVDLFLGVRYAKPPVGNLRFKRPEPVDSWSGIINTTSAGSFCPQFTLDGQFVGTEDCLYLDIIVPGCAELGPKKAVMIFIHGGGFFFGAGSGYIGGPLATSGDVIVVSLNYRLGILGFLSDGPETGNFGLWDQRAAIIWVKENIAQFGGDSELITIFGESSGASSVSAQTLSPHNDGLFQRAILQSGTAFQPFTWYLSRNARQQVVDDIKRSTNCTTAGKVYDCVQNLSVFQLFTVLPPNPLNPPWQPVPDDDFFPNGTEDNPSYNMSRRFDLMAGMNGQEGTFFIILGARNFAIATGRSIENGVSRDLAEDYLRQICADTTPLSVELCKEFFFITYRLNVRSDRVRGVHLSFALGDYVFGSEIDRQLQEHSGGDKSTYAYYFTYSYDLPEDNPFHVPSWLKVSASHIEELPFLFGASFIKEQTSPIWSELIENQFLPRNYFSKSLNETFRRFKLQSSCMMQHWTNFAKHGNPSHPAWKMYDGGRYFNLKTHRLDRTQNRRKLEYMRETLLSARDIQLQVDLPEVL